MLKFVKGKVLGTLPGVLTFFFLLAGIFAFNRVNVDVRNFHLVRDGLIERAAFPVRGDFAIGEPFSVEFDLVSSSDEVPLHIIPDDCVDSIFIDGQKQSLAGILGLCSFNKGFDFSGSPGFYQVYLQNKGGIGGFDMVVKKVFVQRVLYVVNTLLFLVLLGLLLRRFRVLPLNLTVMLLIAVGLHCAYTSNTNYLTRSYDTEGHVDYVKYIAERHSIPDDDACWSCYHPPVYYVLGAAVWRFAPVFGLVEARALQWFSFVLSIVLLVVGVKILMLLLKGPPLLLASILWLFWPVLFMTSPRVGNDQLFFVTHAFCLLGCLEYILHKDDRYMVMAAVMVAFSFWTKSTGTVTALVFVTAFALGFAPRKLLTPNRGETVAIIVFVLFFIGVVLTKFASGTPLVGNLNTLHSSMHVGADLQNLLFFDVKEFLTVPYTSGWDDVGGRQYMLNYLAKTSMFGETVLEDSRTGRNLATAMSFLFVGLLATAFVGFLRTRINRVLLLLLLQAAFFFAALVGLRVTAPFGCSSDFRYVVPVLLSFVPFVGLGVFRSAVSPGWKYLGVGVPILFTACTIWLMMLL